MSAAGYESFHRFLMSLVMRFGRHFRSPCIAATKVFLFARHSCRKKSALPIYFDEVRICFFQGSDMTGTYQDFPDDRFVNAFTLPK